MFDWFWWIFEMLYVRLSQPDMWKYWLIDEGWLFIFIGSVVLFGIIGWLANWLTKFWPFNRIEFAPKGFEGRGRYIGRKVKKSDRGDWLFNTVVPDEEHKNYVSFVIFFSGGFDKFLIPDRPRKNHYKWKYNMKGRDLMVHAQGLKEKKEDLCKVAASEPVKSDVAGLSVFEENIQNKLDRIEDLGEKAIRGSVEAQEKLLDRGSVPLGREYYPDFAELQKDATDILEETVDEEEEEVEEVPEERAEEIHSDTRELEIGDIDAE